MSGQVFAALFLPESTPYAGYVGRSETDHAPAQSLRHSLLQTTLAALAHHACHRAAAASSASRASTQVAPPSANSSRFQNGALVLSQSIKNAVASSAGWRCAAVYCMFAACPTSGELDLSMIQKTCFTLRSATFAGCRVECESTPTILWMSSSKRYI
jgi:hypothetical protein